MAAGSQGGKSNNPNGRPKGSVDKMTAAAKEAIVQFVNDNIETVQEDFDNIDSKDRLQFIEKILSYVIPKQAATHHSGNVNTEVKINPKDWV